MRPRLLKTKTFWLVVAVFTFFLILQADAKTVVDQMGRKMTVPDSPKRVVSLAPSITEIIFALDQENRLKGVTTYSNYPPAALTLPKVGTYIRLDLERIVALNPDLCIAVKDGNPKAAADRLTELNIPVYAVNPRDIETVAQAVIEIGGLLNAEEKAAIWQSRCTPGFNGLKTRWQKPLIARAFFSNRCFVDRICGKGFGTHRRS